MAHTRAINKMRDFISVLVNFMLGDDINEEEFTSEYIDFLYVTHIEINDCRGCEICDYLRDRYYR